MESRRGFLSVASRGFLSAASLKLACMADAAAATQEAPRRTATVKELENPKIANRGTYLEAVDWTLYDTEPCDAHSQAMLFQVPLGSGYPPKQIESTNMLMHSMLPRPQRFRVFRLNIALLDASGFLPLADPRWRKVMVALHIGDVYKRFLAGAAWEFAHPLCVMAGTDASHKPAELVRLMKKQLVRQVAHPPIIEALEWFYVLAGNSGAADVTVRASLRGELWRSQQ